MVMRYGIDGIGYMPAGRSNNVTYIQNNFYGSAYGSNANYGYANFGYGGCYNSCSCFGFGFKGSYPPPPPPPHSSHHHCDDGELPGIAKWTLGIGVTSSLVGLGLKLFSKDS